MRRADRRQFLATVAAAVVSSRGLAQQPARGCTLSIGTYSFPGVSVETAIGHIARIGFDGLEIAAQPKTDGAPERMTAQRRKEIRGLIADKKLRLVTLMEHLVPSADAKQHVLDSERLGKVFELGRELAPDRPPPVQTVLGGGNWDQLKNLFRDRLGDWLNLARKAGVVLAIKPHRFGAMTKPAEALWLMRQLDNPPLLRMIYDYSHYAFRDLTIAETVAESLPVTAQIAVKDAVRKGDKVVFQLPGEAGTIDYPEILRLFHRGGYRGDVCCEVSAMVSGVKGYDPVAAATTCYRNMSRAFEKAGIVRS